MQELIFVTGMGRSGTSTITRLLALCGAALPPLLVPAGPNNPMGFWEPSEAVALNDKFMNNWGSSWYDPTLRYGGPADTKKFIEEIAKFLRSSFGSNSLCVLKEPRISGLLDFWIAGAKLAGFRVKILHIFRNPDEVAASLAAREKLTLEHSQALWLKYNLKAERSTRHLLRVFVSYDQVMADPDLALQRCNNSLCLNLALSGAVRNDIHSFLHQDLRHHIASNDVDIRDGTRSRWIRRVYQQLIMGAVSESLNMSELDNVFNDIADNQDFIHLSMKGFKIAKDEYDNWLRSQDEGLLVLKSI